MQIKNQSTKMCLTGKSSLRAKKSTLNKLKFKYSIAKLPAVDLSSLKIGWDPCLKKNQAWVNNEMYIWDKNNHTEVKTHAILPNVRPFKNQLV